MKKSLIMFLFLSFFTLSGCTQNTDQAGPINNIPVATSTPVASSTPIEPIPLDEIAPDEKISGTCQENDGVWLNEYKECENISLKWCENHGGVFNSCGSACRHQAKDTVCTLQCVPFCDLSSNQSAAPILTSIEVENLVPEVCGPCRAYSAPVPGWCSDGVIVIPEKDRCGCVGHPICEKK